jgi:hypothetical protein
MHRLTIIVLVLLLAGGIAIFKLATDDPAAHETMVDLSDIDSWEPTTEQIRQQLDTKAPLLARKKQYSRLLRSRYRSKDMPVNLRVDDQGNYYLECAATIPTWDKALIAHQVWREIHALFGESPRIIIYESYIGTSSRRVGEARADAEKANVPSVVFDTGWHLRRQVQATDFLR